jgi:hypothetical protein
MIPRAGWSNKQQGDAAVLLGRLTDQFMSRVDRPMVQGSRGIKRCILPCPFIAVPCLLTRLIPDPSRGK